MMENFRIKQLRDAIALSPENALLYKMLGEELLFHDHALEAETVLKKALQLLPNDLDIKLRLADAFFENGKISEAEVVAEEVIAAKHFPAPMYQLLSRIAMERNDPKRAFEFYQSAVRLDETCVDEELKMDIHEALIDSGAGASIANSLEDEDFLDGLFAEVEKPKISFKDVGGMNQVKSEIDLKIIQPLLNPDIYKAFGKKIGGGVLLYGPPGCGKTLLARATAGEINAAFINVGINDVLDMWLGNSEKNLHEIFNQARASQPCVLFFDEVDALGANRSDMRHTNTRFIINQFLDELDGVKYSNDGVLILAATNTPWYLDTAFRRPGRFDRIIFVSPPDIEARAEIFKIHLQPVPTEGVDTMLLAKATEDFSGADIKLVVDLAVEAKLPESLRQGKVIPVGMPDLKAAIQKHRSTTKEWFSTAKNHALYANEGGLYDDVLRYLKIKK
jgi:ATP-dependent 26S proteasome regulatory subunit